MRRSNATRPTNVSGPRSERALDLFVLRFHTNPAAHLYPPLCRRKISATGERHRSVARESTVCNTGSRSKTEPLMTLSTSLVAVWYSSDSCKSLVRWRSSLSNRAFSIAMTACAAKFSSSATSFSENGFTSSRPAVIIPSSASPWRSATHSSVRVTMASVETISLGSPISVRSGIWTIARHRAAGG